MNIREPIPKGNLAPADDIEKCRLKLGDGLIKFWETQDEKVKEKIGEDTYTKAKDLVGLKEQISDSPTLDPEEAKKLERIDAFESIHLAVDYLKNIDGLEDGALKDAILHWIHKQFPNETIESLLDDSKHTELKKLGAAIKRMTEPEDITSEPEVESMLTTYQTLARRVREFYQIVTKQEKYTMLVHDNRVTVMRVDIPNDEIDKILLDSSKSLEERRKQHEELVEAATIRVELDGIYINDQLATTQDDLEVATHIFDDLEEVTEKIQSATLARLFS